MNKWGVPETPKYHVNTNSEISQANTHRILFSHVYKCGVSRREFTQLISVYVPRRALLHQIKFWENSIEGTLYRYETYRFKEPVPEN